MCSVIGGLLLNPTEADLKLVRNVLVESSIRGLHATGLSYIKNNKIITVIEPSSSEVFLEKHPSILTDAVNEDGNLYMVAHCRYSTSDLQYNQPMYNNNFSIVHNGVITQELPEKWKGLYGYDCFNLFLWSLIFKLCAAHLACEFECLIQVIKVNWRWPSG